jgi:hypothetical protein
MRSARSVLAALLFAGATADAQIRQMELQLDSLAHIAARARSAVQAYDDSVRRSARALDTVYVGHTVVVSERLIAGQTRAIVPVVMDSVDATIGRAISRVAGFTFRAQVEHSVAWRRADTTKEVVVTVVRSDGSRLRAWRAPLDSTNIAASLQYAIIYTAFAASDAAFLAWAGNGIPHDTMRASNWANQRVMLVSSSSAVASRCYRGDVRACRTALMLSPSSNPILDWHDSTTRRSLVRRHVALARRMDASAAEQCLAGSDAACITVLQLLPRVTFHEPAAGALRAGLLRHALASGGAGALERLLLSNDKDRAARLEAAAAMPMDSLISSWLARVRTTRGTSEDLTIGITMLSLAWATGIGALSLRSSRWR